MCDGGDGEWSGVTGHTAILLGTENGGSWCDGYGVAWWLGRRMVSYVG